MSRGTTPFFAVYLTSLCLATPCLAQQVCLPAPRLLTVTPMGGQLGTTVDVTVTHQNGDGIGELLFSTPKISAKPMQSADGKAVPNKFQVIIAPDAPVGVHDARLLTSLGVSAARTFSVGILPEVTRTKENQSLETAWALHANSICNAATGKRAIDYYSFKGTKGRRVVVDCNAARIDSKLSPVVILADSKGNDLIVNRTSGVLDYTPESDGTYFIKIHDLTFQGGTEHFYRLALREVDGSGSAPRQETTARVSAFSWPPDGLAPVAPVSEVEPNNQPSQAQKITLPCDFAGSFATADDTDIFEFQAAKGEVWWVEVASERLGLNTDPAVLIQRVVKDGEKETLTDVAELDDMAAPMKMGTYQPAASYSGPAYQAGSPDVLGKFEVKEDGLYRLQLRNLTSDTRNRGSAYRLLIRKAQPDFAVVAWAAHQRLRQNDFGTISKPIALRAGTTMAFEVVTVRRDGFDGEINLGMEDLPPGVTAGGLTIPAGKVQGMLFVTAAEGAAPAFSIARIVARAFINGNMVTHPCRLASVLWPVDYAPVELPKSRLVADVPVSVTDFEKAPVSVAANGNAGFQVNAGGTLKIPLRITWRSEFNGTSIKLKPYGSVFGAVKEIDLPIKAATSEVVLDMAALKTPPGDYTLAFSGIAVIKHRPNQNAVKAAEAEQQKAGGEVASLAAEAKGQAEKAAAAPAEGKEEAMKAAKAAADKHKAAEVAMAEVTKRLKTLTDAAATKDVLDFIVSEPIQVSVKAAPAAQTAPAQTPVAPGTAPSGTAASGTAAQPQK
ncbi:MAG: PPC domain-containing protein [Verrucomicrobiota bacterium]